MIDLVELLEACLSRVRRQAGDARVLVRSAVSERLPRITADRASLTQGILNLLASAIDQTPPGGSVILSAQREDDGALVVNVRDGGESRKDLGERFVVFRDSFGDDPVAVIVGTPDLSKPVPVRIHSACLTGDVFGSRRCDCGDQLRLALARLQQADGGIILYLAQEGRGVGLANKMRTYTLQDAGLDTVDANTTLGFDDDERDYGAAVRMLQMLGATRVVLLTNNPAKLDSLAKAGIEISGRTPLEAPVNAHNRRYLKAKAARAGHHLGGVIAAPSEPPE